MRRFLAAVAGVVVGLVLVVLVADAPARASAERRVAADLQASAVFAAPPEVELAGWPFLWHAATGSYPSVAIRAAGVDVPVVALLPTPSPLDGAGVAAALAGMTATAGAAA